MDGLFVLIVLLLLAAPIIGIVALIRSITDRNLLRQLDARVKALEHSRVVAGAATAARAEPAPAPAPIVAAPIEPTPSPAPPRPQPTSVPLSSSSPPTPSSAQKIGLEERFGTRWVVWVGGVALALGGIFLVRYTIQQGLIGPGVRIFLGALLAVALVAAGEWSRRTEKLSALSGVPSAHIPATLTAAGTTVAYATVYAAYGLYGFLPPAAAFILLGAVALVTLGAALLHGPALAGLGVIGAYLAPALVASAKPDYWALYICIAVVTAAAFALARGRMWQWLAIAAIVLSALWTFPGADVFPVASLGAHVFNVLAGFVLAAAFLVCGLLFGPDVAPGEVDRLSAFALGVYLLAAAFLTLASQHDPAALTAFVILTVATIGIAWRAEAATGAVPVAAILAMAVMAHWAVAMNPSQLLLPGGPAAPAVHEPQPYDYGSHLVVAGVWAVLFGMPGFLAQGRSVRALAPMLWCASGVFVPLAMLVALYYRIAGLDRSLPFAGLALLLAAIYALSTENLIQRDARPGIMAASAMYATGALAALALALTFALEKGWLTVGLALMAPGIAWVADKRPLPLLRWIAATMAGLVMVRIAVEPRIVGDDLGTTPFFNWLLYGYGVPALAFWSAGFLLRRRRDDVPSRIMDAAAILFTVLFGFLEIRHYVTGGNIYRPSSDFVEIALYTNVGLAITIGLERVRGRSRSIVHDVGAIVVAVLTLLAIAFDLAYVFDPRLRNTPMGGAFVNLILLAYGLPAVLAIALTLIARTTRPLSYRIVAAITAVTLGLFYLTLEVRRLFHGPILAGPISDAEQYSYSTAWLLFGIVLLAAGFILRSQPARLLALGVIALTVGKVFIIDTASISGIYRALSAIGLGIVLLGIGWLYQRLLYPRTPPSTAAVPQE